MSWLIRFSQNRWLKLFVGIVLLITSAHDIFREFNHIGVQHGIFIFSIVHILKSLSAFIDQAKEVEKIR